MVPSGVLLYSFTLYFYLTVTVGTLSQSQLVMAVCARSQSRSLRWTDQS